jgi:hypothetical protein
MEYLASRRVSLVVLWCFVYGYSGSYLKCLASGHCHESDVTV